MISNISPEQFVKEVRQWGAMKDSLIKIRMMEKGEFIYCRMPIPRTIEVIQTRIPKEKYAQFDFMNLTQAVPAVWDDELDEMKKINRRLEELNAITKPTSDYRGDSLFSRPNEFS